MAPASLIAHPPDPADSRPGERRMSRGRRALELDLVVAVTLVALAAALVLVLTAA